MPFLSFKGLCSYLLEQFHDAKERGVVIGFDARHNSTRCVCVRACARCMHACAYRQCQCSLLDRFAKLAANAFVSKGVKVFLFSRITPTPFVVSAPPVSITQLRKAQGATFSVDCIPIGAPTLLRCTEAVFQFMAQQP